MSENIDEIDLRILECLQRDATLSADELAEQVHLSRNACWRRVKALEARGVISGRVALVDPDQVGCGLQVMVLIKSAHHAPDWLDRFHRAVASMPEVMGAYRMTGDLDYMLRVRVADVAGYDRFYKTLIARVPIGDVSASFVMEEIKETTVLPL